MQRWMLFPPTWLNAERLGVGDVGAGGSSTAAGATASNDTNQPQVLHTPTCTCTDKTCLMLGGRADPPPLGMRRWLWPSARLSFH